MRSRSLFTGKFAVREIKTETAGSKLLRTYKLTANPELKPMTTDQINRLESTATATDRDTSAGHDRERNGNTR